MRWMPGTLRTEGSSNVQVQGPGKSLTPEMDFPHVGAVMEGSSPLEALRANYPDYGFEPMAETDPYSENCIRLLCLNGPSFGYIKRYRFERT